MEDMNVLNEEKNAVGIAKLDDTPIRPFSSMKTFATAQRMAMILCSSSLVPAAYQGRDNLPNCVIALEMANRTGVSPFLIMQNMHVIKGKPSMSAQYLIAMVNASGKFSPLRWKIVRRGLKKFDSFVEDGWDSVAKKKKYRKETVELEDCTYIASAKELSTGEMLEGPEVTTSMVVAEGWYGKDGSKWKTMPDLMFRYRSAAFFSRMYCPEMAMGLHTTEEMEDVGADAGEPVRSAASTVARTNKLNDRLKNAVEEPDDEFPEPHVVDAELKPDRPASEPKSESKPEAHKAADEPHVPETAQTIEMPEPKKKEPVPAQKAQPDRGQQQMDFNNAEAPGDDAFDIPIGEPDGDLF